MTATLSTEIIWQTLGTILDPEFGINIVDMGLIYDVKLDGPNLAVAMTLTTPSCPASDMIFNGVRTALSDLPGAGAVHVELVWDPAWNTNMLTDDARRHLGWTK